MKSVSPDLNTYLNSEKNFQCCDLYKMTLKGGQIYYFADYDTDVTWNSHVWQHNKGLLSRDQTKLSGEPTVDTMTVTIACDVDDKLGTTPIILGAHNGMFDKAQLALYKAYFNEQGATVGAYELFAGSVEVSSAGGIVVKLTIKSNIQGLNQLVPVRIFAPQEAYANVNGTVTTSSTDTVTMMIPLKPSSRVLIKV